MRGLARHRPPPGRGGGAAPTRRGVRRALRRERRRRTLGLAAAVAALALAAGPAQPAAATPEQDYVLHCMGCHGADGRGAEGWIPSLVDVPGRLLRAPGGRAYLVRVPGVAQSTLDDAALAALLDWMLERFSPETAPAQRRPYSAEEVGRLRRRPLVDVEGAREGLLRALEEAAAPRPAAQARRRAAGGPARGAAGAGPDGE